MFKVIVIDDEPVIIRDVKSSIESMDEEFQVIGTATDGSTGLGLIRELKPDLVFVDICMPVLDGLQLIETLRKEGNMVPTVILSGYQEFEFAKKAIRLEVLDYLVKPMNPLTLKQFLVQLKDKLLLNRYEQQKQCLEQIIHFNPVNELQAALFEAQERFIITKICFGAFNFFRNNQFAPVYSYSSIISLKEICEQILGKARYWILEGKYENESLLAIPYRDNKDQQRVGELYEAIRNRTKDAYFITFVSSAQPKQLGQMREELIALEGMLYHESIFGISRHIIKDISNCDSERERKERKNTARQTTDTIGTIPVDYAYIEALITKKKKNELLDAIRKLLQICQEANCTQANLNLILKRLMKVCCPKEATDEIDFMINLIVVNALDYDGLFRKLCEVILEYSGIEEDRVADDASARYVVYKVQEYLDSHYQEKVLIQDVADKFGFNCSYLCHVFRKRKNVSPNEYIIGKRMDMAKKLLEGQLNLSIKEIAAIVGYEDQYYFSRLFKMYAGVAPTDYRKDKEILKWKSTLQSNPDSHGGIRMET